MREDEIFNGPQVVSLSGGRTSAYLTHLMEGYRALGANVTYVFMDTGAEHPKTYEFIRVIAKHWKLDIICLRVIYNETLGIGCDYEIISVNAIGWDLKPWRGMTEKYGTPQVSMPYCTARMKTEPYNKFCNDRFGHNSYTTWLGIRCDESRMENRPAHIRLLKEISDFDKRDVIMWWRNQPFDLGIAEHLGNCVFCIKKGLNKIAIAAKDEPALALQFIEMAEGAHVRIHDRKHAHKRMYRSDNHLSDVIAMYADVDRDELYRRTDYAKQYDSGSCSESCEVFGG